MENPETHSDCIYMDYDTVFYLNLHLFRIRFPYENIAVRVVDFNILYAGKTFLLYAGSLLVFLFLIILFRFVAEILGKFLDIR